jgi:hypothetical protein
MLRRFNGARGVNLCGQHKREKQRKDRARSREQKAKGPTASFLSQQAFYLLVGESKLSKYPQNIGWRKLFLAHIDWDYSLLSAHPPNVKLMVSPSLSIELATSGHQQPDELIRFKRRDVFRHAMPATPEVQGWVPYFRRLGIHEALLLIREHYRHLILPLGHPQRNL